MTAPAGALESGSDDLPAGGADLSFAARMETRVASWGGLFLGFSQYRYACRLCPAQEPFVSTGWEAGLRLSGRVAGVEPWASIGTVIHRVDATLPGEDEPSRSSLGYGAELGTGFDIPIGERLRLRPQARYVSFEVAFEDRGELRVRHWVGELGLVITL